MLQTLQQKMGCKYAMELTPVETHFLYHTLGLFFNKIKTQIFPRYLLDLLPSSLKCSAQRLTIAVISVSCPASFQNINLVDLPMVKCNLSLE